MTGCSSRLLTLAFGWIALCTLGLVRGDCADRIVLAPDGDTLAPYVFKTEVSISPQRNNQNLSWFQYGTPGGIEMELERTDLVQNSKKGYSFNLEYPLIPDLGRAPAIAVGVRDILGTGDERQSLYAVLAKRISLSDRQYRLVHHLTLDLGVGTGRLNGPFLGVSARLATGLELHAEVFRQRLNVNVGVPILKNLQAKAYSVDGTFYYGATVSWMH